MLQSPWGWAAAAAASTAVALDRASRRCPLPRTTLAASQWPSSFERFCAGLLLFRLASDVAFYTTHRLQHAFPRVYSWTHARHHQHRAPSLLTNFRFTWLDLWLEGSLPSLVAAQVFLALGLPQRMGELHYYMACVQWYQIGSHNAKDLPCITALPLVAPLYNHTLLKGLRPDGLRDHRHVRFHAAHHRAVKGNYGISPWMDWLLGTAVRRHAASAQATDASLCDAEHTNK